MCISFSIFLLEFNLHCTNRGFAPLFFAWIEGLLRIWAQEYIPPSHPSGPSERWCDIFMMPPRTTEVGRGFPTFRVRNSITYRYSQSLELSIRRRKTHTLVNDRQVRGHRRHGQELLPCPDTSCLTATGFLLIVTQSISFVLRLPEADHCLQVIVTYSMYASEWTEVLQLQFFRIP